MRAIADNTPVITGTGLVTALGFGVATCFEGLLAGRTGIAATGDASPDSGCALGAPVERPYLRIEAPDELRTQEKFLNGASELAVQAAHEAYARSGWADSRLAAEECGLWTSQVDSDDWQCSFLQTAVVDATEDFTTPLESETMNRSAVRRTKPFFLLDSLKNNAFSFLAKWWDLCGANTSVAGFASGTLTLVDVASRCLARGDQTRALVVAAGRAASGVVRRDFRQYGLSHPTATPAYRPLDAHGTGCVPGEGAAALTLERYADAKARGAEPLGAVLGYGAATGAPLEGVLAPTSDTLRAAVEQAVTEARIEAGDLMAVVVPAFGLPAADRAMLDAIAALPATEGTPIVAWRGATGHCALASELVEVVVALEALRSGRLPGTVGVESPLASDRPLPTVAIDGSGRAILVLSAGLQGESSALVVGAV